MPISNNQIIHRSAARLFPYRKELGGLNVNFQGNQAYVFCASRHTTRKYAFYDRQKISGGDVLWHRSTVWCPALSTCLLEGAGWWCLEIFEITILHVTVLSFLVGMNVAVCVPTDYIWFPWKLGKSTTRVYTVYWKFMCYCLDIVVMDGLRSRVLWMTKTLAAMVDTKEEEGEWYLPYHTLLLISAYSTSNDHVSVLSDICDLKKQTRPLGRIEVAWRSTAPTHQTSN